MMGDNKAFASLSSGLLARKGQARPAMRPQGFGLGQGNPDDLGWNDMGHDVPRPAGVRLPASLSSGMLPEPGEQVPPAPVVHQQEIARAFAAAGPDAVPVVVEPAGGEPVVPAAVESGTPEPKAVAETAIVELVEPSIAEMAVTEHAALPAKPVRARATRRKAAATPSFETAAAGRKAAFTLRLDPERHLRLRLACAVQNRSAQMLVTDALDRLLDGLPDVARLVADLADRQR